MNHLVTIRQLFKSCFIFPFLLVLLLTNCGGGGGGTDTTPPARTVGTISGKVFDAPVSGATVSIWAYENGAIGKLLGQTTTDSFGNYSVSIQSGDTPVLITSEGGAYVDPATSGKVEIAAGQTLRMDSVANYSEGVSKNVMITPLTYMASGLAQYKIKSGTSAATAIGDALTTVNNMYGWDVNSVNPADITKTSSQTANVTDEYRYGAVLTAYSSYAQDTKKTYLGTGEDTENLYSSMNLANIQYQDIQADGKLDGVGVDANGLQENLSFGGKKITSDVYTSDIAKHTLVVVSSPTLNQSTTNVDDYKSLSQRLNNLGTASGDTTGVPMPQRQEEPLDDQAPSASRSDSSGVLTDDANVTLQLTDNIGVTNVSVALQTKENDTWRSLGSCDNNSAFCSVDLSNFQKGARETSAKVTIHTIELDNNHVTAARLVVFPVDVMDNTLTDGEAIEFQWDNSKPVIVIESGDGIKDTTSYTLSGYVKSAQSQLKSIDDADNATKYVAIDIQGEKTYLTCTDSTRTDGSITSNVCAFTQILDTSNWDSTTAIKLSATGMNGKLGNQTFTINKDTLSPTQTVTYPDSNFSFVNIGSNATDSRTYNSGTYPDASTTLQSQYALKINYAYAVTSKLRAETAFDAFSAANITTLKTNSIPYFVVEAKDQTGGSSANNLTLQLSISTSQDGNTFTTPSVITSKPSQDSKIPHMLSDTTNNPESVTFYVPFTQEIFGSSLKNITSSSVWKVSVQTIDGAGNASPAKDVYFKGTLNLPIFKVVTPFKGAIVQLQGLSETGANQGNFENIGTTCTTEATALDVASCSITADVEQYQFLRLKLSGTATYGKWAREGTQLYDADLTALGLSIYFEPPTSSSKTLYFTELTALHTGKFENQWNPLTVGGKTATKAKEILASVQTYVTNILGFDPTSTAYLLNSYLSAVTSTSSSQFTGFNTSYQYRFLLEALQATVGSESIQTTVNLAAAIYNDLLADDTLDGKGANGDSLSLLENEGYRRWLNAYRTVIQNYGGTEVQALQLAQQVADKILATNANLDQSAPEATFSFDDGVTHTTIDNKDYVAGAVGVTLSVSDASKINTVSVVEKQYAGDSDATGSSITLNKSADESSDYKKVFHYSIDQNISKTLSKKILGFTINAADASQNQLTNHQVNLYFDNDAPEVTATLPLDSDQNELPDETYFSLKDGRTHMITYTVDDMVGDVPTQRTVVFKNATDSTQTVTLNFTNETSSPLERLTDNSFISTMGAGNLAATVLKDGTWNILASAEDKLGNHSAALTQIKQVHIDSTPPKIGDGTGSQTFAAKKGGNATWSPSISWETGGSPAKSVTVKLLSGNGGQERTLGLCSDDATQTCILNATHSSVEVQLVASDLSDTNENQFTITATDTAFPNNTSSGAFSFTVDKTGPVVTMPTDWFTDNSSGGHYVLGNSFKVSTTKITDDSTIRSLSLYKVNDVNDRTKDDVLTTVTLNADKEVANSSFDVDVTTLNSAGATPVLPSGQNALLALKATDEFGFVSASSPTKRVLIDTQGPSFSLNGYNANTVYSPGYVFTLMTKDYDENGNETTDKNLASDVSYKLSTEDGVLVTNGNISSGEDKITLPDSFTSSEGPYNLVISGKDLRGNQNTGTTIPLQIQFHKPTVTSAFYYQSDFDTNGSSATPITSVTQSKSNDVVLIVNATDTTGVQSVSGRIKLPNAENSSDLTLDRIGTTEQYKAVLDGDTVLNADGTYQFTVTAQNNIQSQQTTSPYITTLSPSLSVLREGIRLNIESPKNFNTYTTGLPLTVSFSRADTSASNSLDKLECWIINDYSSSTNLPSTPNATASGFSDDSISCTINADQNLATMNNPSLVVRTTAQNDAQVIQAFSFAMLDTEAPQISTSSGSVTTTRNITGKDVSFVTSNDTEQRMVKFTLYFDDQGSGFDVDSMKENNFSNAPTIRENSITPTTCREGSSAKLMECDYQVLAKDWFQFSSSVTVHVDNVKDVAGNKTTPELTFNKDATNFDKPVIISPSATDGNSSALVKIDPFSVTFKVKQNATNGLRDVRLTVSDSDSHTDTLSSLANSLIVSPQTDDCPTDYDCYTVTPGAALGSNYQNKALSVQASITDVWGITTPSDSISVIHDDKGPVIGDLESMTLSDGNVTFKFDVTDAASGLASVTYAFPETSLDAITQTSDMSSFSLPVSDLDALDKLKVTITATDKAGLNTAKQIEINITKPKLSLTFTNDSSHSMTKVNGQWVFIGDAPKYTLSVSDTSASQVSLNQYSVLLQKSGESTTTEIGSGNGSTTGEQSFNLSTLSDGVYTLTIRAKDSLSRTLNNFTIDGESKTTLTILVDRSLPTLNLTKDLQQTANDTIELTVQASDTNLSSITAQIVGGVSKTISSPTSGSDAVFSFDGLTVGSTYQVKVTAIDKAGNSSETVTSQSVTIRAITATVSATETTLQTGGSTLVTFTFSEKVAGFDASDVELSDTSGSLTTPTSSDDGLTWTATYTAGSSVGSNTIMVEAGSYQSTSDDGISGQASNTLTLTVTQLTVAISSHDSELQTGGTTTLTFTFSDEVSGFEASDISSAGTISNLEQSASDAKVWTATYTAGSTATSDTVRIAAGAYSLNRNTAIAGEASNDLTLTVTQLTVAISSHDSELQTGGTTTLTFTFSDEVSGFEASDISSAGTISNLEQSASDAKVWTATYTAGSTATSDTVRIAAGAYSLNRNTAIAGEASNDLTLTVTQLTVAISSHDSELQTGGTTTLTFTFSDEVSGFEASDISSAGTISNLEQSASDAKVWTATYTAGSTATSDTVRIAAGAYSLNRNTAIAGEASNDLTLTVTQLTVAISSHESELQTGGTTTLTFTFSDEVSGFEASDISSAGTISNLEQSASDAKVWTATYTAGSTATSDTVRIAAGAYSLNRNTAIAGEASNDLTLTVTQLTVAISSHDSELQTGGTTTLTFTFSDEVSGFEASDISSAGTISNLEQSASDAKVWTATYTAGSTATSDTVRIAAGAYSLNRNTAIAGEASNDLTLTVTQLTVAISSHENELQTGGTTTLTFTFSDEVSGFEASDISSAGTISNLEQSASDAKVWTATYTAGSTATSDTVRIAAGVYSLNRNTAIAGEASNDLTLTVTQLTVAISSHENELQTGGTTTLTFTFSDEVSGFEASDISSAGTISNLEQSASDAKVWTATYTAGSTATSDTVRIAAGAYSLNRNTAIAGEASNDLTLTVTAS